MSVLDSFRFSSLFLSVASLFICLSFFLSGACLVHQDPLRAIQHHVPSPILLTLLRSRVQPLARHAVRLPCEPVAHVPPLSTHTHTLSLYLFLSFCFAFCPTPLPAFSCTPIGTPQDAFAFLFYSRHPAHFFWLAFVINLHFLYSVCVCACVVWACVRLRVCVCVLAPLSPVCV